MKCAVHAELDATGFCRNCGKALCPQCTREVKGALYCEECLAAVVAAPRAAGGSNPGLACGLGFVPGLGAVYNGEYLKALIQVAIFGGLIAILNTDLSEASSALFGILLAVFYFYMPVDSYRVAKARQLGQAAPAFLGTEASRRPTGAFILIALGVLFLLGNFGVLRGEWIEKGWPVGLIILGAWLLVRRTRRAS